MVKDPIINAAVTTSENRFDKIWILWLKSIVNAINKPIKNTVVINSAYTPSYEDQVVFVTGTTNITLPTGLQGKEYRFVNFGVGSVTVSPASGENIRGGASAVTIAAGSDLVITFEKTIGWY